MNKEESNALVLYSSLPGFLSFSSSEHEVIFENLDSAKIFKNVFPKWDVIYKIHVK